MKDFRDLTCRPGEILVFGSNLRGFHGAGAAFDAVHHHGAIPGQGIGRQGMSYAIPTKDADIITLPLEAVAQHVAAFLQYAIDHLEERFCLTRIGCGLAGFSDEEIAPLFKDAPANVRRPLTW